MITKEHHKAWLSVNPHRSEAWLSRKLAEGFHVHHIDCDPSNNDPDNLLLLDGVDHLRLHGLPKKQELKVLARRQRAGKFDYRDALWWRVGAVCYVLRGRGWSGHAAFRAVTRWLGEEPYVDSVSMFSTAGKFAEREGLEWPLKNRICRECSKILDGRRRNLRDVSGLDQRLFPNGVPHRLSMHLPICDLLSELDARPITCVLGSPL